MTHRKNAEASCLVLEGGGLRGVFTSGVLEYFLDQRLGFDHVIGVSAGACVGASYLSGQKGRNRRVNVEYPSDRRYMGPWQLITKGSYFNWDFVFGEIPERLVPFDETAMYANPAEFDVVTTSLETGESVVFGKEDLRKHVVGRVLRASSSIPFLAQPVDIGGHLYFDGGVSDSIPVAHALGRHQKAVVVLTRPRGYRKKEKTSSFGSRVFFKKHPAFGETLAQRNRRYNQTLEYCQRMEDQGRLFILAPDPAYQVGRLEPDLAKRTLMYNHGYEVARDRWPSLQAFLER